MNHVQRQISMKIPAALLLFFALLLLSSSSGRAQYRFGYVDANVIVQNMPEFKEIESQLTVMRESYEDTLRQMQAELQRSLESYKKDVGGMTPEARDAAQGRLNGMQGDIVNYQNDRLGPTGRLVRMQEELLAPVRRKALEATEKVAKNEKLAAVFDLSTFIYVDKKMNVNVTYKVLEYLSSQQN